MSDRPMNLPKMMCGADRFECDTFAEMQVHMAKEHDQLKGTPMDDNKLDDVEIFVDDYLWELKNVTRQVAESRLRQLLTKAKLKAELEGYRLGYKDGAAKHQAECTGMAAQRPLDATDVANPQGQTTLEEEK